MTVTIKRVYEDAAPPDGYRVLVDRLWPRGVSKSRAAIDLWLKEIAPSPQLRTWWNHDSETMDEFAQRYRNELDSNSAVAELRDVIDRHPVVTLLYGARDPHVNHAAVLLEYLSREGGAT
ncbi:MAG TPA: DUF488 family protein [Galbitalea sp.]|nr:DUF488 family protein [Galbitalea sp.]